MLHCPTSLRSQPTRPSPSNLRSQPTHHCPISLRITTLAAYTTSLLLRTRGSFQRKSGPRYCRTTRSSTTRASSTTAQVRRHFARLYIGGAARSVAVYIGGRRLTLAVLTCTMAGRRGEAAPFTT
eukprot:1562205-Rhodomonas_salina.1